MRRILYALILIFLIASSSYAGVIRLDEEGTPQGYIANLNIVGAGATAARSGITGTITIQGATSPAPSTTTSSGTAGDVAYDTSYAYFCIAINSWKRVALVAWAVTDRLFLDDGVSHLLLDDGASKLLIR